MINGRSLIALHTSIFGVKKVNEIFVWILTSFFVNVPFANKHFRI